MKLVAEYQKENGYSWEVISVTETLKQAVGTVIASIKNQGGLPTVEETQQFKKELFMPVPLHVRDADYQATLNGVTYRIVYY